MAQRKLTMVKGDVESAINGYVLTNQQNLLFRGKCIPDNIHSVSATFQSEYVGTGNYCVLLDIRGSVADEGGVKENEHYQTLCNVKVSSDSNNSPIIEIREEILLKKLI